MNRIFGLEKLSAKGKLTILSQVRSCNFHTFVIQNRLVALNKGTPAVVHMETQDKIKIVIQEIMQDKIYLDTEMNVQVRGEPSVGPPQLDLANLGG